MLFVRILNKVCILQSDLLAVRCQALQKVCKEERRRLWSGTSYGEQYIFSVHLEAILNTLGVFKNFKV
jgi:hypothetical protein